MHRLRWPVLLLIVCALATGADGEDSDKDRAGDAYRRRVHEKLDAEIEKLTARIEESPKNVELYSRRGDARFFRGQFAEAVADFDRMVDLKPDLETSHWRRGIARFYAQKYDQAAHQFEIYHSFDNVDRENGIWRYLSQVKAVGKAKAREGLLRYEKDDREPFPDVYRLFAGDLSGKEVIERINRAEIGKDEREKRLFYAELYVGLNDFVEGDAASAEKHLAAAVRNHWGETAGGGPTWMWHVARVHHDLLRDAREKAKVGGASDSPQ
jgi:lipoprotein NlpI